jgi:hypothetical protein
MYDLCMYSACFPPAYRRETQELRILQLHLARLQLEQRRKQPEKIRAAGPDPRKGRMEANLIC